MTDFEIRQKPAIGIVMDNAAKAVDGSMAKEVLNLATRAGDLIRQSAMETFPSGTGELGRSFLPATFIESSVGIAAGALSDRVHARIQNEGGEIHPKTAQMLSIPLTKEAKRKWPRDWPSGDLMCIKSKRGKLLLIGTQEKRLTVHYVLKDSITIDPTYYIDWAREEAKRAFPKQLGKNLRERLNESMRSSVNG